MTIKLTSPSYDFLGILTILLLITMNANLVFSFKPICVNLLDFKNYTQDEMNNAIPRDIYFSTPGRNDQLINSNFDPLQCSSTFSLHKDQSFYKAAPANMVGKVFFTISGNNYVCSASIGKDGLVWTAGHCTHDINEGFASSFTFYPSYFETQSSATPYYAKRICTSEKWGKENDIAYDYSLVTVSQQFPSNLGYLELKINNDPTKTDFVSYGYPQGAPFNGKYENTCDGFGCGYDYNQGNPNPIYFSCDSTGGSSGGPWIVTDSSGKYYIASLNSYGYSVYKNRMYGPNFNSDTEDFLSQVLTLNY